MPSSSLLSDTAPILVSSSDDESKDENLPLPAPIPLVGSIEHEPALAP